MGFKKLIVTILIFSIFFPTGCKGTKISEKNIPTASLFYEEKSYNIPLDKQKINYSSKDFIDLYSNYLKLNNNILDTPPENDKTKMSEEDKNKYYKVEEITGDVKEEIKCQIFKVNYTCETYVIYNNKVFHIGFGFGGFGIVSLNTCDFDKNGQKDLIYTFSYGSGLHRSQIGVFNFTKEKEESLDFSQLNQDVILEKIEEDIFKIYIADVKSEELDYTHFNLTKKEYIADIKMVNGKIKIPRI